MANDTASKEFVDFYEFLMVSPDADKPMIEWAVRLLATRYGKKNGEFVDEAKYNLVRVAFRTLSDPAKRAQYDTLRAKQLGEESTTSAPDPEPAAELEPEHVRALPEGARRSPDDVRITGEATAEDALLQQRVRQGIISSLYDIMVTRPRHPELSRAEIAQFAGITNDEMEFALWYLRESELLRTTAEGLYTLTAKGVEWAEGGALPHLSPSALQEPSKQPPASEGAPPPSVPQQVV